MRSLTLVYDGHCPACRAWARNTAARSSYLPITTLSARSPAAALRHPRLAAAGPSHAEPLALDDAGRIWRGAGAWRMGLWALVESREWSHDPACVHDAEREHAAVLRDVANRAALGRHHVAQQQAATVAAALPLGAPAAVEPEGAPLGWWGVTLEVLRALVIGPLCVAVLVVLCFSIGLLTNEPLPGAVGLLLGLLGLRTVWRVIARP
jgi:hypothetical protein